MLFLHTAKSVLISNAIHGRRYGHTKEKQREGEREKGGRTYVDLEVPRPKKSLEKREELFAVDVAGI